MSEAPRLALFDIDHTLLSGDTDELWCEFLMDEGVLDRPGFEPQSRAVVAGYADGSIAAADYCAFYAATLAGRSEDDWRPQRDAFVAERISPRLGAAARALVARHRDAGERVVLTTATNRFLAAPIAASLGVADLVATELEVEAGIFTGRNRGELNMRDGKPRRLAAWLAAQGMAADALATASFYSDSANDLALLRAVGRPVAVDPDPRLAAEAHRLGWPVLRLPR